MRSELFRPTASVTGEFCAGGLVPAVQAHLNTVDPDQLPVFLRAAVKFECERCAGQNVLCTASARLGADFGRDVVRRAIRAQLASVAALAPWLNNADFAWACAQWPYRFAAKVNAKAISSKRIYSVPEAYNIIAGGNANCILATERAPPQHAHMESAVRAWNIWRKSGLLLAPWVPMLRRELIRCIPLPEEIIALVIGQLAP